MAVHLISVTQKSKTSINNINLTSQQLYMSIIQDILLKSTI